MEWSDGRQQDLAGWALVRFPQKVAPTAELWLALSLTINVFIPR